MYVCHEKSSPPTSELRAGGAKGATRYGRLWPSDDDDDDGDDDDVGGWVRGADAGTESHRSALHAQEPLPGWRARNLLKSCHSTNTW